VAGEVKELAGFQDEYTKLNPREADSLYRPLVHIMEDNERGVFESLSLSGKRNFLRQFWARRDPSPGTPENESRDKYYKAIDEANRRFREGGAAEVPGWRTDRGRIFIRYGEPDEKLSRPQAGATRPYEVWKYTRGRPRLFVFMDETRFGHYTLLYTNERREPSQPNWESILGREAVQEIIRF
jgi:GWxTD domain-containing protein